MATKAKDNKGQDNKGGSAVRRSVSQVAQDMLQTGNSGLHKAGDTIAKALGVAMPAVHVRANVGVGLDFGGGIKLYYGRGCSLHAAQTGQSNTGYGLRLWIAPKRVADMPVADLEKAVGGKVQPLNGQYKLSVANGQKAVSLLKGLNLIKKETAETAK